MSSKKTWPLPSNCIHVVDSTHSEEFTFLLDSLSRASIVAMDAEWKPLRSNHRQTFPRVSILQLACRINSEVENAEENYLNLENVPAFVYSDIYRLEQSHSEATSSTLSQIIGQKLTLQGGHEDDDAESMCSGMVDEVKEATREENNELQELDLDASLKHPTLYLNRGDKYLELSLSRIKHKQEVVFLLDLLSLPIQSFWEDMKRMLVSPSVLKLGFKFKQDLFNLAKTFPGPDAHSCFDKVDPYVDIGKVFLELINWNSTHVESVSLATICEQVVGYTLCKDLQCSNWEQRPLTDEQQVYAAADAHCLLVAYDVLESEALKGYQSSQNGRDTSAKGGISELLSLYVNVNGSILHACHGDASVMVRAAGRMGTLSSCGLHTLGSSRRGATHSFIAKRFGERLLLNEESTKSVLKLKKKKKKGQKCTDNTQLEPSSGQWLPPWDPSCGGDGTPKFVCDNMVEGLAKQLRNVGFDTISIHSKADQRKVVELAEEEGRVFLTQDVKLLRTHLLPPNYAYCVKNGGKQKQLAEVVKRFNLEILEDNLLSRCSKCNGDFFPNPLTPEEALAAVPEGQVFPEYAIRERVLFWQCSKCMHMYWQGKQFHRALQTFQAFAREVKMFQ